MWSYDYQVETNTDELVHYGVKGMKWGVRRARRSKEDRRKQRARLRENDRRHTFASNTVNSAKATVVTSSVALGTALIGSATTAALARKGKTQAAVTVYKMARRVFDEAAFAAKISAGATIVNAMMTNENSMKNYLKERRKIKNS